MAGSSEGTDPSVRVGATAKSRSTIYARSHRVDVGDAVSFDEKHDRITALELTLGALGADLASGLLAAAARRRISTERVEALVRGRLKNPLVHLGVVGEEGHAGLEQVTIKLFVSTLGEGDDLSDAWTETLERSPLYQTLRRAVQVDLQIAMTS
jgi:hypothetical protein